MPNVNALGAQRQGVVALLLVLLVTSSCGGPAADHDRLKILGNSVNNYKDTHGRFPPPVVLDESGRRMHSWRVLLVPFVEANAFYSAYDFDSACNDSANADLADGTRHRDRDKFPNPADVRRFYQPRLTEASAKDFTTCFLWVARGDEAFEVTPSRQAGGRKWKAPVSSESDEVLIIQVKKSPVHWMEPRDVVLTSPAPDWGVPLEDVKEDVLGSVLVSSDGRVTHRDREATLKLLVERKSTLDISPAHTGAS